MKKADDLSVNKLGPVVPYSGPSPAQTLCLGREGSFPLGFTQPKRKLKLRSVQCKLYSMAKEWRSGNLVHRSTSHSRSCGERDLILKNKDSAGRSEADDGEAFASFFGGRGGVSLKRDATLSLSFFGRQLPVMAAGRCVT